MVNERYKVGYSYEYRLMKKLQKLGWLCYRAGGSKGQRAVDLIAVKRDDVLGRTIIKFIQVKATSSDRKPLSLLKKNEREELKSLCKMFEDFDNVKVELWVFRRGKRKKEVVDLKERFL